MMMMMIMVKVIWFDFLEKGLRKESVLLLAFNWVKKKKKIMMTMMMMKIQIQFDVVCVKQNRKRRK